MCGGGVALGVALTPGSATRGERFFVCCYEWDVDANNIKNNVLTF